MSVSARREARPSDRVVLIGLRDDDRLRAALQAEGLDLVEHDDADAGIAASAGAVAVFAGVDPEGVRARLERSFGGGRPVVVQVGRAEAFLGDALIEAGASDVSRHATVKLVVRLADALRRRDLDERTRAAVYHDLHNPLTVVEALIQSISRRELLSPDGRAELESLLGATRRLATRLDAFQGQVGPVLLGPLRRSAQPVRALVTEAAQATGLPTGAVRWMPVDADPVLDVDPERFRRVLEHLLANARRHGGGGGELDCRIEDNELQIEVSDRGTGLGDRWGRGLQYCRDVVEAHGGRLTHRATAQGGALVRCVWPGVLEVLRVGGAPPEAGPTAAPRVWFADDEALVRKAVARLLRHAGYDIQTFGGGEEMLQALAAADPPPEAVVCDAEMPGKHGLDVLREVARLAPLAARVLYTAYWPTTLVVDAFNEGVVHRYVNKGQGSSEIEACLSQVLAQRRAAAKAERDPRRAQFEEMVAAENLTLHVQPLFDARTGELVACEALLRSLHPAFRGPLEILDAARAYSREYSLQRLLAKVAADIRHHLPPRVDLFVNVDPMILRDPDQLDVAFAPLYPLARNIVLELTERAQLGHDGGWESAVSYLRNIGFRIALDDVGAGYNSLGAVAAVTPEVIKLDISLVSNIHRHPQKQELVKLLCDYAERREIRTVAEGIESEEEARSCRQLGARLLQGYHLGRPVPLERLLEQHGPLV